MKAIVFIEVNPTKSNPQKFRNDLGSIKGVEVVYGTIGMGFDYTAEIAGENKDQIREIYETMRKVPGFKGSMTILSRKSN